jgi:hypothetical protein
MAQSVTRGELRPTDNIQRAPMREMRLEEYIDSEGVTRYKLNSAPKFDDEKKARVVEELALHGRIGTAARKAGVCTSTVKKHVERDPEFGRMVMEAVEAYKDKLITHHQNLIFDGQEKVSYDRNGNIVSVEKNYPIRLIELELKKYDEGYRDKKEVNMNVRGGVLVAPAEISMDDWETKFAAKEIDDIEDAEVVNEVKED